MAALILMMIAAPRFGEGRASVLCRLLFGLVAWWVVLTIAPITWFILPRLLAEEISDAVPGWQNASLWYCGPVGLANTLFNQFRKWGMPARRMHREFFDMR